MKGKLKVYLDTSVISALFDDRNPERKFLTELFFKESNNFEIYVSNITIVEIEKTPDEKIKRKMKEKIKDFSILTISNETEEFGNSLIKKGAINKSYSEDAYHIAIAIINEMDFLLSWNFRHIVRNKTRDIVRMINTLNNLKQISIITPAELIQRCIKVLIENEIEKIKKKVEKEFPNDLALQQIHIARKIIAFEAEMKGLSYLDYIKSLTKDIKC